MRLPEKISSVLEGLLEDLKSRDSTSGVGLFGSWSRGDAVPTSDVDLLLVDNRDFNYEYVERAEIGGNFLDLDYIPERWVLKNIPPEIDQKIFEAQILFDRESALANAKDLISKVYRKPERTEIRTESYLMEADTYLSRARSAYSRDDFQSAKIGTVQGLETILKILIEIDRMPISNTHFITALESSSKTLGMNHLYDGYAKIAGYSELDRQKTVNMYNAFSSLWKMAVNFVSTNSSTVKTLHPRVKNKLNYYGKENFQRGITGRAKALLEDGLLTEAAHYMSCTSIDMLENYAWLVSTMEGTRFDYVVLFQYLKSAKASPKEIYHRAVESLGIEVVTNEQAESAIDQARDIIFDIRQRRRELITNLLGS